MSATLPKLLSPFADAPLTGPRTEHHRVYTSTTMTVPRQTTVTAYVDSKQLLSFVFASTLSSTPVFGVSLSDCYQVTFEVIGLLIKIVKNTSKIS